jgi:hypothetical protein
MQHVIQFIKESNYTAWVRVEPTSSSLHFYGNTPGSIVRQNNELKNKQGNHT